jgi:hypothetical protein
MPIAMQRAEREITHDRSGNPGAIAARAWIPDDQAPRLPLVSTELGEARQPTRRFFMPRRNAGMWAGVVLGSMLVGCTTMAPEPESPNRVTKALMGDAREIGPLGGSLSAGVYTLTIPPGALTTTLVITMDQETAGEWPVRLGPEGTQFIVPVTLEFDASSEPDPNGMVVAWWNPGTSHWVDQLSEHDGSTVRTHISHFSRYVLH